MITFDRDESRFNLRAAAVIVRGDQVLLARNDRDPFYFLPGGRGELHETSAQTAVREVAEEVGVEGAKAERLLWFVEHFFRFLDRDYHELGLYYLVSLPRDCDVMRGDGPFFGEEHDGRLSLEFRWFDRASLSELFVHPGFLPGRLTEGLPTEPMHLVERDGTRLTESTDVLQR